MKDQTRRSTAYWRSQASKPTCSEPGCKRPASLWTRRRSFCTTCAPDSALRAAYEQLWTLATSPTTLILDTSNAVTMSMQDANWAAAAGLPINLTNLARGTQALEPLAATDDEGEGLR